MVADTWVAPGPGPVAGRLGGWFRQELELTRAERPRLSRTAQSVWRRPALTLVTFASVSAAGVTALIRPGDTSLFVEAGTAMLGPGFLDVFADPLLQIGPVFLLVVGALARVALLVGLPADPTVAAVLAAAVAWLTVVVTGGYARDAGRDVRTAQWVVGGTVVVGGLLTDGVAIGHPEEIALGLMLAAAARAGARGRGLALGAIVGLATGTKLWGVLGAGAALQGRRWRTLLPAAGAALLVVAVLYAPFFLWGDVGTFSFTWDQTDRTSLLPIVAAHLGLSDWGMRVIQGGAAAAAGALVALRGRGSPLVVVVTVVAVRLLLDPLRFPYYVGPLVAVVLVWAWTAPARPGPVVRTVLLAAVPFLVVLPYAVPVRLTTWTSTFMFAAVPVALLWRERRWSGRPGPSEPSDSPTHA
ncbi:hypothetical protein [Cellulomonas sp. URHB0016]